MRAEDARILRPSANRLVVDLDTQIGMADRMSGILASKATRLKLAMIARAFAVFLTAIGIGVD